MDDESVIVSEAWRKRQLGVFHVKHGEGYYSAMNVSDITKYIRLSKG